MQFEIDTGEAKPVKQQQYPHPEAIHDKIKVHVDDMLERKVI